MVLGVAAHLDQAQRVGQAQQEGAQAAGGGFVAAPEGVMADHPLFQPGHLGPAVGRQAAQQHQRQEPRRRIGVRRARLGPPAVAEVPGILLQERRPQPGERLRQTLFPGCGENPGPQLAVAVVQQSFASGQEHRQQRRVGDVRQVIRRGGVQHGVAAQPVQVALEETGGLRPPQRAGVDLLPQGRQAQRPIQAVGFLGAGLGRRGRAGTFGKRRAQLQGAGRDFRQRHHHRVRPARLGQPGVQVSEPRLAARRARVGEEQARLQERQHRPQPVRLPQCHRHFHQVPDAPARLPAVAEQCQQLQAARVEVGQPAVDHRGVGDRRQATFDQLLGRPLVARLAQLVGDLAQERFVVALQRQTEAVGPGWGNVGGHCTA